MSDHSAIEWTDATWNPLRGCSRVSAGCQHCYAERVAARFSGPGMPYEGLIHASTKGWNGKVRFVPEVLDQPLRWKKPRMIFVNSMSDLFHESVQDNVIAAIFGIMTATPQHTYQVLTKRPERMKLWFNTWMHRDPYATMHECVKGAIGYHHQRRPAINNGLWPLPNVWLGVSVENQATADERIPLLLQCPAAVRWLSCEPLLGSVDLRKISERSWDYKNGTKWLDALAGTGVARTAGEGDFVSHGLWHKVDWVVAGGESGPNAHPMHPDWARSLRDQCAAADVPFFFKQWGEWAPADHFASEVQEHYDVLGLTDGQSVRIGKKHAGRRLDGVEHNAYPAVVR